MPLTKDQARQEAVKRWLALPAERRETSFDAEAFAAELEGQLDFEASTNRQKLVAAWLILAFDREYVPTVEIPRPAPVLRRPIAFGRGAQAA